MKKEGNIVSYKASELPPVSAEELALMHAIKDENIDFSDIPEINAQEWRAAKKVLPVASQEKLVPVPVKIEVLDWFQEHSNDYQASINHVLKHYILSHDLPR